MAMRYEFSRNACFHTSSGACECNKKAICSNRKQNPDDSRRPGRRSKAQRDNANHQHQVQIVEASTMQRIRFAIKLAPNKRWLRFSSMRTRTSLRRSCRLLPNLPRLKGTGGRLRALLANRIPSFP